MWEHVSFRIQFPRDRYFLVVNSFRPTNSGIHLVADLFFAIDEILMGSFVVFRLCFNDAIIAYDRRKLFY